VAQEGNLPIIASPPDSEDAPKMCTQDSFGLHITNNQQAILMKVYQKHYWGSPTQRKLNARRTYVEGFFGVLKGDTSAAMKRGNHLYTGLAHSTLNAAIFGMVSNIILLRSWHLETTLGDPKHPLLEPEDTDILGHMPLTREQFDMLQQKTQAA